MPHDLSARMLVNLPDTPLGMSLIDFYGWCPTDRDPLIVSGDWELRLWIDAECVIGSFDARSLTTAHKVRAEGRLCHVEEEVIDVIRSGQDSPASTTLGTTLFEAVASAVNGLITFARINTNHFWLTPIAVHDAPQTAYRFFALSKVEARIDDEEQWLKWRLSVPSGHDRGTSLGFIRESDRAQLTRFVSGEGKPDLLLELLTKVEQLRAQGERRAALMEATTALEVAIADFCASREGKHKFGNRLPRAGDSGERLLARIGKTGFLMYVVPILFEDQEFPRDLIEKCLEANNARNNMVHSRQRDILPQKSNEYLVAIRDACLRLHGFTEQALDAVPNGNSL